MNRLRSDLGKEIKKSFPQFRSDLIKVMSSDTFHSNVHIEIYNSSIREKIGKVLKNKYKEVEPWLILSIQRNFFYIKTN